MGKDAITANELILFFICSKFLRATLKANSLQLNLTHKHVSYHPFFKFRKDNTTSKFSHIFLYLALFREGSYKSTPVLLPEIPRDREAW